jgi:hypothetical protein
MLDFYEGKGRKIFVVIMIIFVLLFTLAFFVGRFYALWHMPQNTSTQMISEIPAEQLTKTISGQVEYAEGVVEVRENATSGWFTAVKGGIFAKGNELRTLGASRAIVTFEDGSVVRLDENTHIVFVENAQDMKIDVKQGEIFNSVAKNNARTYIVQTDHYAVKALGTEFDVTKSGDTMSVLVVESAVEVQNGAGGILDRIEEGSKAKVANGHVEKIVIADADLADDFITWSTEKNEVGDKAGKAVDDVKKKENKDTIIGSIILSGEKSSGGVRLHWDIKGVDALHGFKVIKSTDANPVYPGDDYQYLSDSAVREYRWEIATGKKYHFRVCVYDGSGKCLQYSNDIYLDTPSGENEDGGEYASSVSLSAKEGDGDVKLTWEISGGGAPLGFKVVKSKDPNPVYPGDDYQYLSDSDIRKYTWEGFSKGKTYHFRVCIYKGGKCGTYSNDVKVSF